MGVLASMEQALAELLTAELVRGGVTANISAVCAAMGQQVHSCRVIASVA